MEKASVLVAELGIQEFLDKIWLRWQEQSTGRQFSAQASSLVQDSP